MTHRHPRYLTLVSSPFFDQPLRAGRTASTHRRANRRVMLKPKPWRTRLETARLYIDGAPAARGFVGENGVEWVAFYDVTELFDIDASGRVVTVGRMEGRMRP